MIARAQRAKKSSKTGGTWAGSGTPRFRTPHPSAVCGVPFLQAAAGSLKGQKHEMIFILSCLGSYLEFYIFRVCRRWDGFCLQKVNSEYKDWAQGKFWPNKNKILGRKSSSSNKAGDGQKPSCASFPLKEHSNTIFLHLGYSFHEYAPSRTETKNPFITSQCT